MSVQLFADRVRLRFVARPEFDFGEALTNLKAAVPGVVWRDGWWHASNENWSSLLTYLYRTFDQAQIDLVVVASSPSRWQLV